ncbi:L,D-transpeptidase [Gelatiniphilus marinus]|uniref:L,D-transpeptidase n=1 Tax=Gelatiniphilus marinus TaxID=1759464 RepID=A0ABW5JQQ3_9FLAO
MKTYKMLPQISTSLLVAIFVLFFLEYCSPKNETFTSYRAKTLSRSVAKSAPEKIHITTHKTIRIDQYFQFLDSIVNKYDSITAYPLSEHLLVRANPWIIDTLKNTDYYYMKTRDSFIYNQKEMIVFPKGATLVLPDSTRAKQLLESFKKTRLSVNIPEFKLRIFMDTLRLYEFPVRVGRNEKKFLKMAGRMVDLKTETGSGTIVKHVRNPDYHNPVSGQQYLVTKRDDGKITKLPQIPFIETEINGIRNGQLIHPTTNPITLGKASSNGCIGTKEADAWVIYYYAPIGTKININYNLNVTDATGKKSVIQDIYK